MTATRAHQPATGEADTGRTTPRWKRAVQAAISLVVVLGIFVGVLPRMADFSEVWATIRAMTRLEIGSLLVVALWNLVTYWFVIVAALPGLRIREAAVVNQASTAVANTLPGGGAIGVGVTMAMLTSWGIRAAAIARYTLVTGIWNNFVKLGMPVLALALLALEGEVTAARLVAAGVGIGVLVGAVVAFGLLLKSDRLARIVGRGVGRFVNLLLRLIRRDPIEDMEGKAAAFRANSIGLVRHRWVALTLSSIVSHVSLYLVLLVTLRHVGVSQEELGWIQVLAAFAFVRLISALPVTPGGVGVVELGYAAALTVGLDPLTKAQVVAAILVFRAITYLLPVPLGALGYVVWRRNRSWRMDETARDELVKRDYGDGAEDALPPPSTATSPRV